jgi:hypothetical protein
LQCCWRGPASTAVGAAASRPTLRRGLSATGGTPALRSARRDLERSARSRSKKRPKARAMTVSVTIKRGSQDTDPKPAVARHERSGDPASAPACSPQRPKELQALLPIEANRNGFSPQAHRQSAIQQHVLRCVNLLNPSVTSMFRSAAASSGVADDQNYSTTQCDGIVIESSHRVSRRTPVFRRALGGVAVQRS